MKKESQDASESERTLINSRIKQLGLRKDYIAGQLQLDPCELSHLIAGSRHTYDKKKPALYRLLGIKFTNGTK